MSLLIARADPDVAIVASETRFCSAPWPHDVVVSDGEPFTVWDPRDGRPVVIPAAPYRNVRPFGRWHPTGGGFMTGTMQSPCLQLVYQAVEQTVVRTPADLEAIATAVRDVVDRYREAGTDTPVAPLAAGAVFLACHGPCGFEITCLRGDGRLEQSAMNVPPELSLPDNGVRPEFTADVLAPLEAAWAAAGPGVGPRMRAIAQAFATTYQLCGPHGTVNDRVELGVLRRLVTPGRWRLRYSYLAPAPADELLDLDDHALEARLTDPTT